MRNNTDHIKWLNKFTKQYKGTMSLIVVLSSMSALLAVGLALATKYIIDFATGGKMNIIWIPVVVTIGVILVIALSNLANKYFIANIYGKLRKSMTIHFQNVVMDKQYSRITSIHTGELVNLATSDIEIIINGYITMLPTLFSITIKIVFGIVFIAVISWQLFLLCAVLSIIIGLISVVMRKQYKVLHKDLQKANGIIKSSMQENFHNIEVIKTYNIKGYVSEELSSELDQYYTKLVKINMLISSINNLIYTIFNIGYYFIILAGVLLLGIDGAEGFAFGSFTAIMQLMVILKDPFLSATGLVPQFFAVMASIERVRAIEDLPPELESNKLNEIVDFDQIIIDNLCFSYAEQQVISNLSFEINKGEKIAIVGESGAGKSTFLKLFLSLLEPSCGSIKVVYDSKAYNINQLPYNQISYVPQSNFLVTGSIWNNLTYGKNFTIEEVENACKTACIYDTILLLESGFDTILGENGIGLSIGQSQRLAIARAILFRSSIIILDECTSALDDNTEINLLNNLRDIQATIICVAHKERLIDFCDKKVVLTKI